MSVPTLKKLIEESANVKINLSTYKCGEYEGYATSIPMSPTVRFSQVGKIWLEWDNEKSKFNRLNHLGKGASTYANRNAKAARLSVLIEIADELSVEIPDSVRTQDQRTRQREFNARF